MRIGAVALVLLSIGCIAEPDGLGDACDVLITNALPDAVVGHQYAAPKAVERARVCESDATPETKLSVFRAPNRRPSFACRSRL